MRSSRFPRENKPAAPKSSTLTKNRATENQRIRPRRPMEVALLIHQKAC